MKRVLIVKSRLEPFRVAFYRGLAEQLLDRGVELRVAVPAAECGPNVGPWLLPLHGFKIRIAGKSVCWQSVFEPARQSDLVIIQQSARELTNYLLLARRRNNRYRLALWGHGAEFQRSWTSPLTEFVKRTLFSGVDYWFAYTAGVADIVAQSGFPPDRICTTVNSIDTASEEEFRDRVTIQQKEALRVELGIPALAPVITYCGSLYKAKRLDFLLEACREARKAAENIHLIIIGDGKERRKVEALKRLLPWLHLLGFASGELKAVVLGTSACMAIPGVVGLAVVDSFVHECPVVTTDIPGHGPEIEYLVDGQNGLRTANSVASFAAAVRHIISDTKTRSRLVAGCRRSAATYTLGNMIDRFSTGILAALDLPRRERIGRLDQLTYSRALRRL